MKHLVVLVPAAALILASTAASAQSLGDVARREQERRKTAAPAQKAYTTGDLKPAPAPAVAPPAPAPAGQPAAVPPSPSGAQPPAAEPEKEEPKKDEKYWRDRMQTERDALQRAQTFAEALQSRINALSTDFVARDDPAQRSVIANDRQKALAEMDRVTREIEQHTKAIADIQEEARRAGVPAGWVR